MRYTTDVDFLYEVTFESNIKSMVSDETIDLTIMLAIEEMRG